VVNKDSVVRVIDEKMSQILPTNNEGFSGAIPTPKLENGALTDSEIAHANLLRLRGRYQEAEDLCLKILEASPKQADALALLGDIQAENGTLENALRWYDLSLETAEAPPGVKSKRNQIEKRIKDRDKMIALKSIGLGGNRPEKWMIGAGIGVLVAVVMVAAYWVGSKSQARNSTYNLPIEAPIVNSNSSQGAGTANPLSSQPSSDLQSTNSTSTSAAPEKQVDTECRPLLALTKPEIASIISALYDPRSSQVTVSANLPSSMAAQDFATSLASEALSSIPGSKNATIRLYANDRLAFIGDAVPGSINDRGGSVDFITMTNVWSASSTSPTSSGSTTSTASGSSQAPPAAQTSSGSANSPPPTTGN